MTPLTPDQLHRILQDVLAQEATRIVAAVLARQRGKA